MIVMTVKGRSKNYFISTCPHRIANLLRKALLESGEIVIVPLLYFASIVGTVSLARTKREDRKVIIGSVGNMQVLLIDIFQKT